jgi:DNA-directed RNA polymerase subunit M/transcription elongation factor TFIIS
MPRTTRNSLKNALAEENVKPDPPNRPSRSRIVEKPPVKKKRSAPLKKQPTTVKRTVVLNKPDKKSFSKISPKKKVPVKIVRNTLPPFRQASLRALKPFLGPESSSVEKSIYNMCLRHAENSEETVEEIYRRTAYQKIGEIVSSKSKTRTKILEDIENDRDGWDSCLYAQLRRLREEEMAEFSEEPKITEGDYPCRNKDCKSRKCWTFQRQDRSADEQASVIVVCAACGTRYKLN